MIKYFYNTDRTNYHLLTGRENSPYRFIALFSSHDILSQITG